MGKKPGRQIEDADEEILDSDSLFDDFSDLEVQNEDFEKVSLDNIETMLIDINEEPFSEKKRSLFESPKPKRKINVDQKASSVIPISPKQFKSEAMGPEDKLETALSNLKFKDEQALHNEAKEERPVRQAESEEERQQRFQELRDMLRRMNEEAEEEEAAEKDEADEKSAESKVAQSEADEKLVASEMMIGTDVAGKIGGDEAVAIVKSENDFDKLDVAVEAESEVGSDTEVKEAETAEVKAAEAKVAETAEMKEAEAKVAETAEMEGTGTAEAKKLEAAEAKAAPVKKAKPKQYSIRVEAFGSPSYKAAELVKTVSEDFKNEIPRLIRIGVLKSLQDGKFDFDKASLVRAGLLALIDTKLYDVYDFSTRNIAESLESESKAKSQILVELVAEKLPEISEKDFETEKRTGILNAVMLGGYEDAIRGKVIYALPIEQGVALKSLMFENKMRLDDKDVARASFAGFISILELEKENDELSPEALKALDWYYENFHYRKYYTEFVKTMNFYIDINDYDFEKTALKYAYHRQKFQEQLVFKELMVGDDFETIAKMAAAKPIKYEQLNKILEDYKAKNNFGEYSAGLKTASVRGKAFKKLKEIYNFEAGTYLKAVKEIKRIRELDNYATFFLAEAESLAVESGLMMPMEYILIRFGYNGFNNVVVLKLLDGVQPILAWRGKTGDRSDGFRDYFKKAENEIKRHRMMQILDSKFNHEILNSELKWQKVWDFLNWPA